MSVPAAPTQWIATDGYYNLKAHHSGKCVNVVGASTADLALLEQRTCGTATASSGHAPEIPGPYLTTRTGPRSA